MFVSTLHDRIFCVSICHEIDVDKHSVTFSFRSIKYSHVVSRQRYHRDQNPRTFSTRYDFLYSCKFVYPFTYWCTSGCPCAASSCLNLSDKHVLKRRFPLNIRHGSQYWSGTSNWMITSVEGHRFDIKSGLKKACSWCLTAQTTRKLSSMHFSQCFFYLSFWFQLIHRPTTFYGNRYAMSSKINLASVVWNE